MLNWDRQSKESARDYNLFCFLRDEVPVERSLERLAGVFKIDIERINELSRKWNWEKRLADFDSYIENKISKSSTDATSPVLEDSEHLDSCSRSIKKLITTINEKILCGSEEIDQLKLDDLIKLLNNFLKTTAEFNKSQESAATGKNDLNDAISSSLADLLKTDKKASQISFKLLERMSELKK